MHLHPDLPADSDPARKRELLAEFLRQRLKGQASTHPASYGQQALWGIYCRCPQNPAYNVAVTLEFPSTPGVELLRGCLQSLADRHEALRTTYRLDEGRLTQHIHPRMEIPLEVLDASSWLADELGARLEACADRPFDLVQGPVVRAALFQRAGGRALLCAAFHHIAVDMWSATVLLAEFADLCRQGDGGPPRVVRPAASQFVDFTCYERAYLASPQARQAEQYWLDQLAGDLTPLALPCDHPRPPQQRYMGAGVEFEVPPALRRQLQTVAGRAGSSLYCLFLSVLMTLLYRYTGRNDVVIGSPMSCRTRPEFEELVGYLSNPVALRGDLRGQPAFAVFLQQMQSRVLEAMKHQHYPFGLLVEKLNLRPDPSRSPVFQVMLMWNVAQASARAEIDADSTAGRRPEQRGALRGPVSFQQRGAPLDLSIQVYNASDSIQVQLRYSTDLFEPATIDRLGGHFQALLASVAECPEMPVSRLKMLTPAQRQQIVVDWNRTQRPYPPGQCLHEMVEAQAARSEASVIVEHEGQVCSYSDLNRRANQLARFLLAQGVVPEEPIGVFAQRSLEMLVATLGILKAGGAYLPLNPEHPPERLGRVLADAAIRVVLTHRPLAEACRAWNVTALAVDDEGLGLSHLDASNLAGIVSPDQLAYVMYTSGSTGAPKGVMITHRAACDRLWWVRERFPLEATDCVVLKTPFDFDVSAWEIFWPLIAGAKMLVARPGGHRDVAYLAAVIRQHGGTQAHFVPGMLDVFLEQADLAPVRSLRRIICIGEPLSPALQEKCLRRLDAELHNLYGPTEASIVATHWPCRDRHPASVPIGLPIANTQIYLLDEYLEPVPAGVPGEIYIGGVGVGRGYINHPDWTAERFVADPFTGDRQARLFKTGDFGRYRADGVIEFLGRRDGQVKIAGNRVELGEIESALRRHPEIRQATVTARAANGATRLTAYVVPQSQPGPSADVMRAHLKHLLPLHMLPSTYILLEELPLTPNGKVDRGALMPPVRERATRPAPYAPPRDALEREMAGIVADVLQLDMVGIYDDLYDLGTTSLNAVRIVVQLQERGVNLPPEMLYEYGTIAELAMAVHQGCAAKSPISEHHL